jgi:formylglycine-generating enzyme required for sulfatase activity
MNLISCTFIITLLSLSGIGHAASGILELDSKPGGAEVFVDGKKKGVTPETEGQKLTMELPEGDHEIVIKKEGTGSATKKIFVGEGVIQPLTLTILPEAYTNSLGMKFVPVPGTQILMCIHETRNKDYAAYAAENSGVDGKWKNAMFGLGKSKYTIKDNANHPVVNVNWDDANAFCAWLGRKDGRTYRLPTDHEWSCAVGIGDQENVRDTPETKNGKVPGFPWGAGYPPPQSNVGNYRDATMVKKGVTDSTDLDSYEDGHTLTAPVMSYTANMLGIHDLGGNVNEWCQDLYKPSENWRVQRGGSWYGCNRDSLASSARAREEPGFHDINIGFRCVVVARSSSP